MNKSYHGVTDDQSYYFHSVHIWKDAQGDVASVWLKKNDPQPDVYYRHGVNWVPHEDTDMRRSDHYSKTVDRMLQDLYAKELERTIVGERAFHLH